MRGGAPLCNFYPVEEIGFHFLFIMAHDVRLQGLPSAPEPHRADQCPVKFQCERKNSPDLWCLRVAARKLTPNQEDSNVAMAYIRP